MTNPTPIRDAATIIVMRDTPEGRAVLMGQRGAGAVFMPGKFVFPGGAVDPVDQDVPLAAPLDPRCAARLQQESTLSPESFAAAAIRELWEETGQTIGAQATWPDAPRGWRGYAKRGLRPSGAGLNFVFRAITPPGRPRRFDARFFLADAALLTGDLDDFDGAEDELAHLQWVPLARARQFDLPFITQIVLAEIAALTPGQVPESVPFFRNRDEDREVKRLGLA